MSNKNPPELVKSKSYSDWVKKINIWARITSLTKANQGGAILMTLEGEAEDAVLEIEEDELCSENGVKLILAKLDNFFKKNEIIEKFEALDSFETYHRSSETSIHNFIIEFDKRLTRTRKLGTQISDDLLAYRIIKSANLNEQDEKVVKATISALTYDVVKEKLKSIFNDASTSCTNASSSTSCSKSLSSVKTEDVFELEETEQSHEKTFYTRGRGSFQRNYRGKGRGRGQASARGKNNYFKKTNDGKNPLDEEGNHTQCLICKSIFHWAPKCPHKVKDNDTPDEREESCSFITQELVMFQSIDNFMPEVLNCYIKQPCDEFPSDDVPLEIIMHQSCEQKSENTDTINNLVSETFHAAVLDSGATKTVAGKLWFDEYLNVLSDGDKNMVKYNTPNSVYKFGDGRGVKSLNNVDIPVIIGGNRVQVNVDIVADNIPLLLSKRSMQKANMKLDFSNNSIQVFNENIKLFETKSGHYALPLTHARQVLTETINNNKEHFTLTVLNCKTDYQVAKKLHAQFAHAPYDRLVKLVNSAGKKWSENVNLKKELKKVSEECNTCLLFKRPSPRPVVGLPTATTFNECVAMDLKTFEGKTLLHIIDHVTRLSASCRVSSKNPEVIVKSLMRIWISIFGAPTKFLSDNGGEFANEEFVTLCEQMNITVKTTAGESPWSNGLVERHNLVISEMLHKVLQDTNCDFDMALCWCLCAKNSLQNNHGFSPLQLSIGMNPRLPSILSNRPPAYDSTSCSNLIRDNLNGLHRAREAFIESERSERISRALSHNVRTSNNVKYTCGDQVYYKRRNSRQWKGPGVVIGQDGQQIFVRQGSTYVRVSPCSLQLKRSVDLNMQNNDFSNSNDHIPKSSLQTDNNPSIADSHIAAAAAHDDDGDDDIVVLEDSQITDDLVPIATADLDSSTFNDISTQPSENTVSETVSETVSQPSENTVSDANQDTYAALKIGSRVLIKETGDSEWREVKLSKRAGKVTGRYKNSWNTKNTLTGNDKYYDLDRLEWKIAPELNEGMSIDTEVSESCLFISDVTPEEYKLDHLHSSFEECLFSKVCQDNEFSNMSDEERCFLIDFCKSQSGPILDAKLKELCSWKDHNVFQEVENVGQKAISARWVITPKLLDNTFVTKARLCARGFEETLSTRTDSPTCSRDGLRIALAMIASNHWSLHSIDAKAAFLQGDKIDREVFLIPPKEAQTTCLWKLNKAVYGLGDAPRKWFLKLKDEFEKIGVSVSTYDNGLFYFHRDSKLEGIVTVHVDDLLWGGTDMFQVKVIDRLCTVLKFGSRNSKAFNYVGMEVSQNDDYSIEIRQDSYIRSIKPICLISDQVLDKSRSLSESEKSYVRSVIGQLNWVACVTRPDLSFDVSHASSRIMHATVKDVVDINKIIKRVKCKEYHIKFPCLDLKTLHLRSYADSSFNNLFDGGSQGGHIIFLTDSSCYSCPIEWKSNRAKRVVRSTLAGETLACADSLESALFLKDMIIELLGYTPSMKIISVTDSKSLFDNIMSKKVVNDKRLRVEIRLIQESVDKQFIELKWIPTKSNLSDPLTKTGASNSLLRETLKEGKLLQSH